MQVWDDLRSRGDGWYWIGAGIRNGDLYHIASLAEAFADTHGRSLPLYLVVGHEHQRQVASLFRESFAEIIIAHGFPQTREEWRIFFDQRGLPTFGHNVPILIHPFVALETHRFSLEFVERNGLTWMQLYKQILHLPGDVEPAVPPLRPDSEDQAAQLCREAGVEAGRSIILFPYAQSLPVAASAHFAEVAARFSERGYKVFTSVSGREEPIVGTMPLFIPFGLLIETCEYAGWVIAVRSGISDIVSPAACNKSFIYPHLAELAPWSVRAMDFSRDCKEIVFNFHSQSATDLYRLLDSNFDMGPLVAPAPKLTPFIGMGAGTANVRRTSASTHGRFRHDQTNKWVRAPRKGDVTVLEDVPTRSHSRLQDGARHMIERLVQEGDGKTAFFASRDRSLYDVFEEVELNDLIEGRYFASSFWHSVVAVRGGRLADLVPDYVGASILPLKLLAPNCEIVLGSAERTPAPPQLSTGRAMNVDGVQFTHGWSGVESWGIWSEGLESGLKLVFAEPLVQGSELVIEHRAALSDAFAELSFDLVVNGVQSGSYRIEREPVVGTTRMLLVPPGLPAARSLNVQFRFREVRSPLEQGKGLDRRRLGLGLQKLKAVSPA